MASSSRLLSIRAGAPPARLASLTNTSPDAASLVDQLVAFAPDYVTFTSVSAARHFREILGDTPSLPGRVAYAAIGPVAARAARDVGFDVTVVPERHTVRDLVRAVVDHASSSASSATG